MTAAVCSGAGGNDAGSLRTGLSDAVAHKEGLRFIMVIDNKIERYVYRVTSCLPAHDRSRAAKEITARESAGRSSRTAGESALTSAAAHLSDHLKEGLSGRRLPVMTLAGAQKIMSVTMAVIMVLAVLLVGFGLLALGTHTINTMLPIFLGCIMALVAVTGRSVLIREYR